MINTLSWLDPKKQGPESEAYKLYAMCNIFDFFVRQEFIVMRFFLLQMGWQHWRLLLLIFIFICRLQSDFLYLSSCWLHHCVELRLWGQFFYLFSVCTWSIISKTTRSRAVWWRHIQSIVVFPKEIIFIKAKWWWLVGSTETVCYSVRLSAF